MKQPRYHHRKGFTPSFKESSYFDIFGKDAFESVAF